MNTLAYNKTKLLTDIKNSGFLIAKDKRLCFNQAIIIKGLKDQYS